MITHKNTTNNKNRASPSLAEIKQISIIDFLAKRGLKYSSINSRQAMYISPLRDEQNASLCVDIQKNLWFDHAIGKGGSIIDLVSIADAISKLERGSFSFRWEKDISNERKRKEVPSAQGISIIEIKELSHPALIRYVESRNISKEVAKIFLSEIYYSANGKGNYYSIAFKNNSGGYELRNKYFKGCTGKKDVTFIDNKSENLNVFEGFFDFLSYLECLKNEGSNKKENHLILNSTAMKHRAIPMLKKHTKVNLFLDNDATGNRLTIELKDEFPNTVIDCRSKFKNYKDFNEFLNHHKSISSLKYK